MNFATDEVTNNTVFVGDDAGGSGTACTNVGEHSGENNTANGQVAVGNYSGQNNSGVNQNVIGFSTGQDNTGEYQTASGHAAGQRNTGARQVVSGGFAGQNNLGDDVTLAGYLAGQHNTENNLVGVGNSSGQWNTGANPTLVGSFTGRWNNSDNITAVGLNAFNTWTDDTPSEKTFDNTDVNAGTDRITLTGHSLGANNSYINLIYTEGTSAITGLTDGIIYQWKIIDVNTVELRIGDITDAGSGTGHKLTPSVYRANSTALGYDAEPDAANQVMLGDGNVTQVKSAGGLHLAGGDFVIDVDGNITAVGNITGSDVDVDLGTGDFTTTGDLNAKNLFLTSTNTDLSLGDDAGSLTFGFGAREQCFLVDTNESNKYAFGLIQSADDSSSAIFTLAKNKGGGAVLTNYPLGQMWFAGWDGNSYERGAVIAGIVDGTPGEGSMPTELRFSVASVGALTERFTIRANGNIEARGDLFFASSNTGLPYGAFYGNNIAWTSTAFGGGGTFVIISDSDIIEGNHNLTAFQNEQELLIDIAGKYLVTWTISGECAGANKHIEIAPGINGTANAAGRNHFETGNANQEYAIAGTTILTLAATNTLSLMLTNVDDNTQVSVHHINLTAVHVGG